MDLDKIVINKETKIIFMGTPEFSKVVLEEFIKRYKVRAVVSQPDYNRDRHGNVIYSPVKKLCMDNEILVLQPDKIRNHVDEILALEPDLIITCAYGQIIPKEILNYPKYGCINIHASLLPKYRGGAPIERAIMNGDKETGITIMYMNEGMDTGDMITSRSIPILDTDTNTTLRDKLSHLGAEMLLEVFPNILSRNITRTKQNDEEATYAFVIKREDERIDFNDTKRQIRNKVRALADKPGAYCMYKDKIWKIYDCYITDNYYPELFNGEFTNIYADGIGVKVSNGEIVITSLQVEGKQRVDAPTFINGIQDKQDFLNGVLK